MSLFFALIANGCVFFLFFVFFYFDVKFDICQYCLILLPFVLLIALECGGKKNSVNTSVSLTHAAVELL